MGYYGLRFHIDQAKEGYWNWWYRRVSPKFHVAPITRARIRFDGGC